MAVSKPTSLLNLLLSSLLSIASSRSSERQIGTVLLRREKVGGGSASCGLNRNARGWWLPVTKCYGRPGILSVLRLASVDEQLIQTPFPSELYVRSRKTYHYAFIAWKPRQSFFAKLIYSRAIEDGSKDLSVKRQFCLGHPVRSSRKTHGRQAYRGPRLRESWLKVLGELQMCLPGAIFFAQLFSLASPSWPTLSLYLQPQRNQCALKLFSTPPKFLPLPSSTVLLRLLQQRLLRWKAYRGTCIYTRACGMAQENTRYFYEYRTGGRPRRGRGGRRNPPKTPKTAADLDTEMDVSAMLTCN